MPGISGLELIERINRTDLCIQFVILSGYGEFEYAKRAMKCGVQHYLLKPCTEEQIIECIKEVTKDYYQSTYAGAPKAPHESASLRKLHQALVRNMIREGISCPQITDSFFDLYGHYIDLTDSPYQLCHVYYLERENLETCLSRFQAFCQEQLPEVDMHILYIHNVLLFFFRNYAATYGPLDEFLKQLRFDHQSVSVEYERRSYPNLKALLGPMIQRLKRYDMLYFAEDGSMIPNFNYGTIVSRVNELIPALAGLHAPQRLQALQELEKILLAVSNRDFLLQLCDNILISLETQLASSPLPEITDTLYQLHKEDSISQIRRGIVKRLHSLIQSEDSGKKQYSPFVTQLTDYLNQHYSDPDLTLKWIAEHYLYMNVNYVGRCFARETGEKFSSYLMKLRVQKAKEILTAQGNEQIQHVAELVGCGNTPYYFSKIFKKCTGFTPSAYLKKYGGPSTK